MAHKVLMVCLGNICRSPIAEGIMKDLVTKNKLDWVVDSAGTSSYHSGEPPHRDSVQICMEHGIDIRKQRSRVFETNDFTDYDAILVMDFSNETNVKKKTDQASELAKVKMLLSFSPDTEVYEVPDPYYVGGFDYVYDLIHAACLGYIDQHQE